MKKLALIILMVQFLIAGLLQPARAFWNLQSNMYAQMGYPTYGYSPMMGGMGLAGGIYGGFGSGFSGGYANYPMYYAPTFNYGYSPIFGGYGYNAGFGYGMYPWYDSSGYGYGYGYDSGYSTYDPYAGYYDSRSSRDYDDYDSSSYRSSYRSSYTSRDSYRSSGGYESRPSNNFVVTEKPAPVTPTDAVSERAAVFDEKVAPKNSGGISDIVEVPPSRPGRTDLAPDTSLIPSARPARSTEAELEAPPESKLAPDTSLIPKKRPVRTTEVEPEIAAEPDLAPKTSLRPEARPTYEEVTKTDDPNPAPSTSLRPKPRPSKDTTEATLEAEVCGDCTRNPDVGLERIPIPPPRPKRKGVEPKRAEAEPRITGIRAKNRNEERAQEAPVWNSFIRNFAQCAPGCEPVQYAAYGKRSNRSCHPTGEAIDVGGMICDGKTYRAIDRGRFEDMVTCMRGKMKTLYRNGSHVTSGHHDHAHFSNGCHGGRTY